MILLLEASKTKYGPGRRAASSFILSFAAPKPDTVSFQIAEELPGMPLKMSYFGIRIGFPEDAWQGTRGRIVCGNIFTKMQDPENK